MREEATVANAGLLVDVGLWSTSAFLVAMVRASKAPRLAAGCAILTQTIDAKKVLDLLTSGIVRLLVGVEGQTGEGALIWVMWHAGRALLADR